jgi:predicted phosphate transport protein (TIGR00153 family)
MGLNSFVKLFTPKDKIFYSLFEEVAVNLSDMSKVFSDAMHEENEAKRNSMLKSLEDFEHKNDDATHRLFIQLGQNFITPFDREDIHYLASSLDDIADYIWASAKRITTYNIEQVTDNMKAMSKVIVSSVEALQIAIQELRNMKNLKAITDACVKVNSFENQADDILDEALLALFANEKNAIELIKMKELYEDMEIVTDKCEDAANVIESIIIKYS